MKKIFFWLWSLPIIIGLGAGLAVIAKSKKPQKTFAVDEINFDNEAAPLRPGKK